MGVILNFTIIINLSVNFSSKKYGAYSLGKGESGLTRLECG